MEADEEIAVVCGVILVALVALVVTSGHSCKGDNCFLASVALATRSGQVRQALRAVTRRLDRTPGASS